MGDTLNGSWGALNFQVPLGEGGLAKWGCHVFSFLFFFLKGGGGGGVGETGGAEGKVC